MVAPRLPARLAVLLVLAGVGAVGLAFVACSDSTPSSTTTDASVDISFESGSPESPDADATEPTDAGSDAPPDSPSGSLLAPTIDTVRTTDAGIFIGWTNNTPSCDSVSGERKTALEAYTQKFNVPGTTTQTLDTTSLAVANASGSQCTYRLLCKKGGAVSPYSNELSSFCGP